MCGLIGVLNYDRIPDYSTKINRALDRMGHRGLPGKRGVWYGDKVALGHVRLPIVDIGPESDQPYVKTSKKFWKQEKAALAFVGEIHNYRQLRPGYSELEIIGEMWDERSMLDGMNHFDGFWSIAVVDEDFGFATFAVDYLAQKPLYFSRSTGVVCSELDPFKEFGMLTLNDLYLSNVRKWGYDPTGGTPYKEVERIPAGNALVWNKKNNSAQFFPYNKQLAGPPMNLRTAMEVSVKNRLVSDVPIALLLSGGLDSTIIAGLIRQMGAKGVSAFYVPNGEDDYAKEAADFHGFELRTLELLNIDATKHARRSMQEPVDLGSVVPQWQLGGKVAAEGFHVALTGDGADELFGGYRRATQYDSMLSDALIELPMYHLPRIDRCMMAHTVEARCPFLAPYVVCTALALPWPMRTAKQALKEVFKDLVPKRILEREKKPLRSYDYHDQNARNAIVDNFIKEFKNGI